MPAIRASAVADAAAVGRRPACAAALAPPRDGLLGGVPVSASPRRPSASRRLWPRSPCRRGLARLGSGRAGPALARLGGRGSWPPMRRLAGALPPSCRAVAALARPAGFAALASPVPPDVAPPAARGEQPANRVGGGGDDRRADLAGAVGRGFGGVDRVAAGVAHRGAHLGVGGQGRGGGHQAGGEHRTGDRILGQLGGLLAGLAQCVGEERRDSELPLGRASFAAFLPPDEFDLAISPPAL